MAAFLQKRKLFYFTKKSVTKKLHKYPEKFWCTVTKKFLYKEKGFSLLPKML